MPTLLMNADRGELINKFLCVMSEVHSQDVGNGLTGLAAKKVTKHHEFSIVDFQW